MYAFDYLKDEDKTEVMLTIKEQLKSMTAEEKDEFFRSCKEMRNGILQGEQG